MIEYPARNDHAKMTILTWKNLIITGVVTKRLTFLGLTYFNWCHNSGFGWTGSP